MSTHIRFSLVGVLCVMLVSAPFIAWGQSAGSPWERYIQAGEAAYEQGNYAEAEPLFQRALAIREKRGAQSVPATSHSGPGTESKAWSWLLIGFALIALGLLFFCLFSLGIDPDKLLFRMGNLSFVALIAGMFVGGGGAGFRGGRGGGSFGGFGGGSFGGAGASGRW